MWQRRQTDSPRLHGLGVAALVFAGSLLLRQLGLATGPELVVYDALLRNAAPRVASSPVLLVEITEPDIQALGHWPVNDRVLARALRALLDAGARVVGVDLYRNLPVPPGTDELARLLREDERIVAVRKFGGAGEAVPGPPALDGTGRVGFNDLPLDGDDGAQDAFVRRALLFQDDGTGPPQSAFALLVARFALAREGIGLAPDPERPEWLRLGATTIPYFEGSDGGYVNADDAGYQMLLDFAAHGAFERVSLGEVLAGELPQKQVADRVVLLGSNATSLPDFLSVPAGPRVSGMAVHGYAVDQLLRFAAGEAQPLGHLAEWQEIALLALSCLLGALLGFEGSGRPLLGAARFVAALGVGGGLLLLAAGLAFRAGVWVPVAAPGLAGIAAAGLSTAWSSSRERWQRDQLMQIFSSHMAPSVAAEIWSRRDEVWSEGRVRPRRLTATVLFVDMQGYTAQAEKLTAEGLMAWASVFLARMAALVHRHGGVVDDYFGDGIKANFGVPIERRSAEEVALDARAAVRCALDMARALERLNAEYAEQGLPSCAARIGIHTGSVVAGCVGSRERLKYTTVGSVPVTAQRLESTRQVPFDPDLTPVRILTSAATRAHLGDEFRAASQGEIRLAGQSESLEVYRIEGEDRP